MPLMGAIGGIGSALLGGAAGAANTRPPALNPQQGQSLNQILPFLTQGGMATPQIDPAQQNLMYGNIAAGQTGANNAVTNALVSRGLGHSGVLGGALTQVANQAQQGRNQANLGLQQQAVQRQQFDIGALMQALNVNATPGQSPGAGFMAGLAPIAAYSIQNSLNNRNNNQFGTQPNLPLAPSGTVNSSVYGGSF